MDFSVHDDEDDEGPSQPPTHPVPQLQGPFEESMMESVGDAPDPAPKTDAMTRRTMLLEMPKYERICAGRWKQKPGEKFHPLWKISAQMSFGIHLLAEGLAKSEDDVMNILQSHVDDVDGFIESTTEDFDLAQSDVDERLRYLKLPLEHADVFDRMLEDGTFRTSIVEGNQKIEHIVERTSDAMKDAMKDVHKGLDSTNTLGKYLAELNETWNSKDPEHDAVFAAMLGNVEGWNRAFTDLRTQGNALAVSVVQLARTVGEMQRRAGLASRKALVRSYLQADAGRQSYDSSPIRPSQRASPTERRSQAAIASPLVPDKPLPIVPDQRPSLGQVSSGRPQISERSRKQSSSKLDERSMAPATKHEPQSGLSNSVAGTSNTFRSLVAYPDPKKKRRPARKTDVMTSHHAKAAEYADGALPAVQSVHATLPLLHLPQSGIRHSQVPETLSIDAVELPASVPESKSVHRSQVPKKRLSLSLGIRSKNSSDHSPSHSLTQKSSGNFLRSPLSSRISASPRSTDSKRSAVSPTQLSSKNSSSDSGYFAPHNRQSSPYIDSSPRITTPDPASSAAVQVLSGSVSNKVGDPGPALSNNSSKPISNTAAKMSRKARGSNPAFTSHPPSMEMATSPPLEKIEEAEAVRTPLHVPTVRAVPDLDSKHTSYVSSLGEPGPEVSAADSVYDAKQTPPIAELECQSPLPQGVAELEGILPGSRPPVELEGVIPASPMPIELEAPHHTALGYASSKPEAGPDASNRGLAGPTIRSQDDFFKLPPQKTADMVKLEDSKAILSAPGHSNGSAGTSRTYDRVPSSRKDRKSGIKEDMLAVPSALGQSNHASKSPENLKLRSDLIDLISSTPPQSPIHGRSSSDTSSQSLAKCARADSGRASQVLAPPDEAPPPPAPGGRSMVNPDFAAAGAFEGERKAKRGSGASNSGWKKMFSGGSSGPSRTGSLRVVEVSDRNTAEERTHEGVDMMTTGGNDVLWFKGMGRDGVWVSGS